MAEGDIREHLSDLARLAGTVDVLSGGPPCQGFSVAGKMNPADSRSQLVWTFLDVVELVKPKVFVIENVAALGRLAKWRSVRDGIVGRANALGYDVSYQVWHAPDYGVPQNRDRVIFVGVYDGDASRFSDAMASHKARPRTAREVLLSVGTYGTDDNPQTCTSNVTLAKHPVMRRSAYAGMLVNGAGRPIDLNGISATLPASMGGNRTPIIDQAALDDPTRINWFETYRDDVEVGRVDPSNTVVPGYLRRLTLKEAAAFQTFPDSYLFSGRKTKQYRQIGNAVPCRFAEAVARSIREAYFDGERRA
jgi:DNA (cytosine-5)-methyltransferase 1